MKVSYPEKNVREGDLKFNNRYGAYLINHMNTFHGGVHIEGIDTPIYSIADGRIIAYRFMDDYEYLAKTDNVTKTEKHQEESKSTDQKKEDTHYKYSNCFILVQHDLELTKEVKENEGTEEETVKKETKYVTFYSVYNHLMPIQAIEGATTLNAPDIFSKEETVVTSKEEYQYKVQGLNARTLKNGAISGVKLIIPYGKKVNIVKNEKGKEIKNGLYAKVQYTDDQGNTHKDIYIHTSPRFVKKIDDTKYEIITYEEDTEKWEGASPKGSRVRQESKSGAIIKDIIPKGEIVTIKNKNGSWYEIEGYEGYSYKTNFTTKKLFDDSKIEKNKIVACDIPVKAGQHLGYTGSLQGELSNWYSAAQIDILMAEGVEEFLSNDFGAGVDKKHFTILPEGTKLKKSITTQVDLPKKLSVEVVEVSGIYVKIREDKKSITATIEKSLLGDYKDPAGSNNAYYIAKPDKFDSINKKYFNNQLPAKNEPLYWVSRAKWDGTSITSKQENDLLKTKGYTAYRKLQYRPKNDPQTYWLKATDLDTVYRTTTKKITITEPKSTASSDSLLDFIMNWSNQYEECETEIETLEEKKPSKGDHTTLNKQITTAYIAIPENETDIDQELCKDAMIDLRKVKKVSQDKDKEWIQVHCSYVMGNKKEIKKGWIENKNFDTFSAYNWFKFGFNTFDGGDEYMYDIKDLREAPSTESEFIKTFWGAVKSTKDEVLDIFELNAAYRTLETQLDIARMVCKHKIEWLYTPQEIVDEVTKFYNYLIDKEDKSVKAELEALRDEKLKGIRGQIEKMMFWKEASNVPYTPPVPESKEKNKNGRDILGDISEDDLKELGIPVTKTKDTTTETKEEVPKKPERTFPDKESVYHFHPYAFINQMKLIFGDTPEYCIQEMKVRAFLRLIKHKEGKPGEAGYRQIVGGGSFNDFKDHPRQSVFIKRIGKPSTAAGAYQFLKGTWDDDTHTKRKEKYGIADFSPLNQDRYALVLLKHQKDGVLPNDGQVKNWGNTWADKMIKKWKTEYPKATRDSFPKYKNRYKRATGDVIQMLIENDLDRALLTAAITWASFPDSKDGQEPSSYSIADAKIKFREFLLLEIKGETDLHLEEGFLKKFGYDCCSSQENTIKGRSPSGKKPIDLRPTIPWHSQFTADTWGPYSHQSWMCYFTSLMILQKFVGLAAGGKRGNKSTTVSGRDLGTSNNVIQIALEDTEVDGNYTTTTPIEENTKTGIGYLDQELEKGNPILVGVRHTYKKIKKTKGYKHEQNHDKSTDHFVIVVGRGYENGKRYFLFYEVGTSKSDKGQHDKNRLYVNDDWSITGIPQHNLHRTYTLTQIRGNKTNGNFK